MSKHFAGDTAVLLGRSLRHIARSPDTIITTAVMPIAFMLLFVYVFGGAIETGSDSYVNYLLPGILLITIASGISYTAFRLFLDLQGGIFERFQSMPIARPSVLWAHVLTSLTANLISLVVVVLVALIMGFRSGAGVLGWLAIAAILMLFALALTWIAVIPGLTAQTVDGASAFAYPLIFLPFISSAFVPTETMPGPVRAFAENQPVTSIVDAIRDLFTGQPVGAGIWTALAWCAGILVVAYIFATLVYRRRRSPERATGKDQSMLTIGQLAAYAGVTVRAVRHYHQIGLLPEPERDASGYRRYGATAVVSLIKIRTLAEAGVPLSQIGRMLEADASTFAEGIQRIDDHLRDEIDRLATSRKQVAQLAAGDSLALPPEVIAYLDRLREIGASEPIVQGERDGWILMAARWPDRVREWMPGKLAQLDDPHLVRLYRLVSEIFDGDAGDDPRLAEAADLIACLNEQAYTAGGLDLDAVAHDDPLFDLLDDFAAEADPRLERLLELVRERGWDGLARLERLAEPGA